jgi:hypothetical protein
LCGVDPSLRHHLGDRGFRIGFAPLEPPPGEKRAPPDANLIGVFP